MDLAERLRIIIRADQWLMGALEAARACNPPDWYVGGGVIRNRVWDYLHGYKVFTPVKDVDVAFYDPLDLRPQRDAEVQRMLSGARPDIPWEATNQAAVHLWFAECFGRPVPPLASCEEAIATWPETVTCIGVGLALDGGLHLCAPYGLEDLFSLILRRNPSRVTVEQFRRRLADKEITKKWPNVRVIDG